MIYIFSRDSPNFLRGTKEKNISDTNFYVKWSCLNIILYCTILNWKGLFQLSEEKKKKHCSPPFFPSWHLTCWSFPPHQFSPFLLLSATEDAYWHHERWDKTQSEYKITQKHFVLDRQTGTERGGNVYECAFYTSAGAGWIFHWEQMLQ